MTPSIQQVLVHLDPTAGTAHRLAAARELAQQLGASLTALYAATPGFIELPYAPELGPTLASGIVEIDEQRRAQALKLFEDLMNTPGAPAQWSQTDEVPIIASFAQQAFYADLLVLGQRDSSDPLASVLPPDFVESVVVASGRPAVVIPYVAPVRPLADTIVIAWKETREATRAVAAAMPLLHRAQQVHVLTWGEEREPPVGGAQLNLDTYLRLHGVQATWHHGGPEPSAIGEHILSRCFDLAAGLLVMGCYGHARAREWVLGGASRTILASMILPVLLAH
jgi:nucleotide-binding universal stress UspA family protein